MVSGSSEKMPQDVREVLCACSLHAVCAVLFRPSICHCLLCASTCLSLTPRYLCSGKAFVSVVEQQAQQGRQYAEDYVKRLEIQRRYLQDTWS